MYWYICIYAYEPTCMHTHMCIYMFFITYIHIHIYISIYRYSMILPARVPRSRPADRETVSSTGEGAKVLYCFRIVGDHAAGR